MALFAIWLYSLQTDFRVQNELAIFPGVPPTRVRNLCVHSIIRNRRTEAAAPGNSITWRCHHTFRTKRSHELWIIAILSHFPCGTCGYKAFRTCLAIITRVPAQGKPIKNHLVRFLSSAVMRARQKMLGHLVIVIGSTAAAYCPPPPLFFKMPIFPQRGHR